MRRIEQATLQPDAIDGGNVSRSSNLVGQLVAEMLTRHELKFLAIDADPVLVAKERAGGQTMFYGDATQIELLRRCGIQSARALVVTLDNADAIKSIVRAARSERPDLTIVARARDAVHATELYELKVTDAVPMGLVIASIHEKRDEFRRMQQPIDGSGRERHAIRASPGGGRLIRRPRSSADGHEHVHDR